MGKKVSGAEGDLIRYIKINRQLLCGKRADPE
jgi:hypothetical protein